MRASGAALANFQKEGASCDREAADPNKRAFRLESQVEELELKMEQLGFADP